MALFAKNKPTERLTFGDDFVELQHLPKGIKDEIKARTLKAFSVAGPQALKAMQTAKGEEDMPAELLTGVPGLLEIAHYKVAKAIAKWSSEEPITEDTVKALDEPIFDEISKKIDEMNSLKEAERKN